MSSRGKSLMGVGDTQVIPQHASVTNTYPGLHAVTKEGVSGHFFQSENWGRKGQTGCPKPKMFQISFERFVSLYQKTRVREGGVSFPIRGSHMSKSECGKTQEFALRKLPHKTLFNMTGVEVVGG